MKYRKYVLEFAGDPEIVAFLAAHVPRQWDRLGPARAAGRAAEALFPGKVRYREPKSVLLPRPSVERVKAL